MIDLETLVTSNVGSSAEWRRGVATRYPEDKRNDRAAEILDAIEAGLPALEGSELHHRLSSLIEDDEGSLCASMLERIRIVGFWSFPETAEEFLKGLVEHLEDEARSRAEA